MSIPANHRLAEWRNFPSASCRNYRNVVLNRQTGVMRTKSGRECYSITRCPRCAPVAAQYLLDHMEALWRDLDKLWFWRGIYTRQLHTALTQRNGRVPNGPGSYCYVDRAMLIGGGRKLMRVETWAFTTHPLGGRVAPLQTDWEPLEPFVALQHARLALTIPGVGHMPAFSNNWKPAHPRSLLPPGNPAEECIGTIDSKKTNLHDVTTVLDQVLQQEYGVRTDVPVVDPTLDLDRIINRMAQVGLRKGVFIW